MSRRKRQKTSINMYSGWRGKSQSGTWSDLALCIRQRRPLVLPGVPEGLSVNIDEMAEKTPALMVQVEKKSEHGDFGRGLVSMMPLATFVEHLNTSPCDVYLSAQPVGDLDLYGEPLQTHRATVPLCPHEGLKDLVLANIHLWAGRCDDEDGSSSRLHHDHHDNVYVLLEGQKTFKIIAPCHAERCETVGEVVHVHPNGRINYRGEPTRADGASPDMEQEFAKKRSIQLAYAAIEIAQQQGDKQRVAELEDEIAALVGVDELASDDDSDEGGFFGDGDSVGSMSDGFSEGHDDFDEAAKRDDPPSFSRLDLRGDKKAPKGVAVETITLTAGQSLYLPAGWFHQVESAGGRHTAVNYWFHPPPYGDTLFETEFKEKVKKLG